MPHRMCSRFIFRKDARHPNRPGAIVCRVTVDKAYKPFTTAVHCLRAEWDAKAQRLKGRTEAVREANKLLTTIEDELNKIYFRMEAAEQYITCERLLRAYQQRSRPRVSLLAAWAEFLALRRPMVGKSHTAATQESNELRGQRLREFLTKSRKTDLLPEEFTAKWADGFLTWLRIEREASQNYAAKVLQTVKQVLRWCVNQEYAQADPLNGYSLKFAPPKPPEFLRPDELLRLRQFTFSSPPLRAAADCFLFQCYTGLAYVDLARFRRNEHTRVGAGGRPWLQMGRQKTQHSTGQAASLPLLPVALELLDKYGERLPVPTNQVYNRYLKEIAAVLGFDNLRLTSHVGRKTAGALLLGDGMSLAAVSKVLGHASVVMTQKHYVTITDQVVNKEFERVYGSGSDQQI